MINWARPDLLALLLLVPVVTIFVVLAARARARVLARIADAEVLATLVPKGALRARFWQAALAVVATAALTLAAAGPRFGFDWQQQKVEGIAMVVVLDVSRSMDAADVSPSRLERARREITDLVGYLRGDSVGLVIFAAGPYVRIPLTVDYDTFLWAVKDSETGTIRAQGTSLSGALDAADGLLAKAEGSGKAIVLVSDGEFHDDSSALDASVAKVRADGIHVYALGIGEPAGAPIPLAEGGFKKDTSANVVLSRLDEAALQKVASATGGAYVRAVASDEDVRDLYQGEIRGKLEAAERGVRREKVWRERYQWPLAVGLFALVASSALGIGRRRRRPSALAATVLLALLCGASGSAWAGTREDGLAALKAQEWNKAAQLLGQARVEKPGDTEVGRGLAEALYRTGRYRESEQLYQTLATQDADHKAVDLYNAGNAAYRGGRLGDALQSFKDAAGADPSLAPAKTNAEAVTKEIAARLQQQPPQQQDSKDQQSQQSQNGGQQGQDGQSQQDQQGQDGQQDQQAQSQQSKDGQKGQDGQAQADQQAQQQQGDKQDGQQADKQDGQQGDKQDGQQGDTDAAGKDAQAAAGDDKGVRDDTRKDGDASAAGDPDGATPSDQDTDAQGSVAGTDDAGNDGDMTKEQAARLVDSVPDGKPRVVVGGRDTEKDW